MCHTGASEPVIQNGANFHGLLITIPLLDVTRRSCLKSFHCMDGKGCWRNNVFVELCSVALKTYVSYIYFYSYRSASTGFKAAAFLAG